MSENRYPYPRCLEIVRANTHANYMISGLPESGTALLYDALKPGAKGIDLRRLPAESADVVWRRLDPNKEDYPDTTVVYCPLGGDAREEFGRLQSILMPSLINVEGRVVVIAEGSNVTLLPQHRRVFDNLRVEPLNLSQTRGYLGENGIVSQAGLEARLYGLTGGYPVLVDMAVAGAARDEIGVARSVWAYFDSEVIPRMAASDFSRGILESLLYFREIDSQVVKLFAEDLSNASLHLILAEYVQSNYLRFNSKRGCYDAGILAVAAESRRVLSPDDSKGVHNIASEYYLQRIVDDWVPDIRWIHEDSIAKAGEDFDDRVPDMRWIHEWLYHEVLIAQLSGESGVGDLKRRFGLGIPRIQRAGYRLRGDVIDQAISALREDVYLMKAPPEMMAVVENNLRRLVQ